LEEGEANNLGRKEWQTLILARKPFKEFWNGRSGRVGIKEFLNNWRGPKKGFIWRKGFPSPIPPKGGFKGGTSFGEYIDEVNPKGK